MIFIPLFSLDCSGLQWDAPNRPEAALFPRAGASPVRFPGLPRTRVTAALDRLGQSAEDHPAIDGRDLTGGTGTASHIQSSGYFLHHSTRLSIFSIFRYTSAASLASSKALWFTSPTMPSLSFIVESEYFGNIGSPFS